MLVLESVVSMGPTVIVIATVIVVVKTSQHYPSHRRDIVATVLVVSIGSPNP